VKTATSPTVTDLSEEFLRRFDTLGTQSQLGVVSLIEKMLRHGHGQKTLIQVINTVEDLQGPPGRDDRVGRLTWIANDHDGLVGNRMMVNDIWVLLRTHGHKGWPDGR
jgi:hypothetical protein